MKRTKLHIVYCYNDIDLAPPNCTSNVTRISNVSLLNVTDLMSWENDVEILK